MAENTAATIMKTGNYPAYSAAKEKGIIEEGIQPLCDALLEIGAHPLASCAGHYSGVITGRLVHRDIKIIAKKITQFT